MELSNRQKALFKKNFPKSMADTFKRDDILLPPKANEAGSAGCCLIVDGMNIAYQAFYAYAQLSYNKRSTSILYGFINILRPIIKQYDPEKVIICWDGKKHPERLNCIPEYKGHREVGRDPKKRTKFLKQIDRTRLLLYYLGIPQAWNQDMEGDDMIYLMTKRCQSLYRVIIVSADKDFKQLINHDVSVYHPRTKYIENLWAFPVANYGLEVSQYKDFLCLTGDKTDDIPGYPNIGEKRASNLLRIYYTINDYLNSDDEIAGLVDKDKLRKIYTRNNKMINLAYFNTKFNKNKITYYKNKSIPKYKEEKYKAYCLKWGLKTSIFPKFLEPFIKITNA